MYKKTAPRESSQLLSYIISQIYHNGDAKAYIILNGDA